jgi:hypothetical protein
MGSRYILSGEYDAYGLPGTTTAAQVDSASAIIDAAIQRPEGLVWAPGANGWPCYMAGLAPQFAFTAAGAIAQGSNVEVPVTGFMLGPDLVGEVLVLDRDTPDTAEACVVAAVGPASITLDVVRVAHAGPVTLEAGLVILEERSLPANRSVAHISRSPVARMVSVQGRYAYGRRSQQQAGAFIEPSLLASVQFFGGAPVWSRVDVNQVSVSQVSGEVWIPAGALNAYFSDVRLRYVAGFAAAALPAAVKTACATVVKQLQQFPELAGSIKALQSGGTKIEKFADSVLDAETRQRLAQFEARAYA